MSVQVRLPLSNWDSEGCPTDILELALVDENPVKRFKFSSCRQFYTTPMAREGLSIAYLMFLEHDRNKYGELAHYACVNSFASQDVQPEGPIHDGTERNVGWTVDNEFNAKGLFKYSS